MTSSDSLFSGTMDRYRGVTVNSKSEPCSEDQFLPKLTLSLADWTNRNVRVVWFHVSPEQADWVPVLIKQGFSFHHANSDRVALLKWLASTEVSNVPSYAHTLVGVGGMVVNDQGLLLVIQERFSTQPTWKLPGGYVEPGEDLAQAAIREVEEETGVKTEFRSIVAFRHGHNYNFGCSDLYIIVALRPLSMEINLCPKELSKCEWMPIKEYTTHPLVLEINRHIAEKFLQCDATGTFIGLTEMELKMKDFVRRQAIYSLQRTDKE